MATKEKPKILQHSQLCHQGEHKCQCMMAMTTVWSESSWGFIRAVLPTTVKASAHQGEFQHQNLYVWVCAQHWWWRCRQNIL